MTIYIKPMTWAGKLRFYLGLKPSDPSADPCSRLGGYFLIVDTKESAWVIAEAEARRMSRLGRPTDVIECPHYTGF